MSDEEEWLSWGLPQRLLELVRSRSSQRLLRLVACAFARQVWNLLTDERSRRIVETAECFADGNCSERLLLAAQEEASPVAATALQRDPKSLATRAARLAVAAANEDAFTAAYLGTHDVPHGYPSCAGYGSEYTAAWKKQEEIFRDIYGNPFRPVTLDPRWLTSTVLDLANTIYEHRQFEKMPILADALMDAGCDCEEIIKHCQGPGPHVRGCWVVDLLTGRE